MGGEDEHAIGRQMLGEKAKKVLPLLAIQVGEQRSAPNQVEPMAEADTADILLRINRRRVELGSAEIHCITIEIAGGQMGIGERRSHIRQTRPCPHGKSRIDVGSTWAVARADLTQSSADLPTS